MAVFSQFYGISHRFLASFYDLPVSQIVMYTWDILFNTKCVFRPWGLNSRTRQ